MDFQDMLRGDEKQFDQLVKLVEGELAGDGNIADRMASSDPGAVGLPENTRGMIDALKEAGWKPGEARSRLLKMRETAQNLDVEFDEP